MLEVLPDIAKAQASYATNKVLVLPLNLTISVSYRCSTWTTAKANEMRRSIKAGECYCPLANAFYTNMLCHVSTMTSVALEVGKGSLISMLPAKALRLSARKVLLYEVNTFMGHAVHQLWHLHDRLAREYVKLGEVIAFRNVISGIPADSAVDEISIQALISQLGYKLRYIPECVVYNKGPLTARDFLKQRRRIYAGHLNVLAQQRYEASTIKVGPILQQLLAARDVTMGTPRQAFWTAGVIALEGYAHLQGYGDYIRKREHHIWQMVDSTKDLEAGQHKVRRVCNVQSVIIFRLFLEGAS
jgi:Glycosyl transferase family group 2